jgi:hypothetical protein
MSEARMQTVSGTMSATTRDGREIVLNWEARASVQDGKETVHVHSWTTDADNNPVQVYQFYGAIISPQLGDRGQFKSPLNVSDYEADVASFDVPEATDVGLQLGMLLSQEKNRDQAVTDVANINFPSAASA